MQQLDKITAQLDRLAAFEPGPFPVISLYLNLQPDQRGRDRFEPFLKKELEDRVRTYAPSGPERQSLGADAEQIRRYVDGVDKSLNGLAVFASSGAGLFESLELAAPVDEHRLYISDEPHLYPLARILDAYPRYLALLTDTHSARIFVFAGNAVEKAGRIENGKTKRHKQGGWAQTRYQRHVENDHLHHVKEVVDTVARIVRDDRIDKIVISGDGAIVPLLHAQMPKEIADRIVDTVKLDARMPDHEVLTSTIAALRERNAETDRERVDALIGAYRGNGLACVGLEATLEAFELGQVDELLIAAHAGMIKVRTAAGDTDRPAARTAGERAADGLIAKARETSAKVRFIEEDALLEGIGGVGAFLRFKL